MLDLTEPLEVSAEIAWGGRTGTVTLWLSEPDDAWLVDAYRATQRPEGEQALAWAEVFSAERLAPLVVRWEGVGRPGAPTPCTADAVRRACGKRAFLQLLQAGAQLCWSRAVRGNSAGSPAGPTGEPPPAGPAAAAAADASPSTRGEP